MSLHHQLRIPACLSTPSVRPPQTLRKRFGDANRQASPSANLAYACNLRILRLSSCKPPGNVMSLFSHTCFLDMIRGSGKTASIKPSEEHLEAAGVGPLKSATFRLHRCGRSPLEDEKRRLDCAMKFLSSQWKDPGTLKCHQHVYFCIIR